MSNFVVLAETLGQMRLRMLIINICSGNVTIVSSGGFCFLVSILRTALTKDEHVAR